jgi:colanic acid biosynthesis glycosyl transferase WcaI
MRVIVWGINFEPELTGIAPFNTGLCDYLRRRGHQVEMITAFPYYPSWRKIPGDMGYLFRTDEFLGISVRRCWHYVPRHVTTLRRIGHELSFGLTSFIRALFTARADVYVIVSPPLVLGPLASIVCWLKRRPYVFHVQDLQPDAAVGLGMIKVGRFTKVLYRFEAWSYRHASVISGISKGMLNAFAQKGVPEEKQMFFPNWIHGHGRKTQVIRGESERVGLGRRFREKFKIPEKVFLATYSGNLGRKQCLETLIEAAEILSRSTACPQRPRSRLEDIPNLNSARSILILIVGDGVMRQRLEDRILKLQLLNVRMMPILIESDYRGMLAASDIGLILQAAGSGQYFFPSKLLSMLSARLPIVSGADDDSALAKAVSEGKFGVNVPPADPSALADALADLAGNPEQLRDLSLNSRWVEQFSEAKVLAEFERKLIEITLRTTHS